MSINTKEIQSSEYYLIITDYIIMHGYWILWQGPRRENRISGEFRAKTERSMLLLR